MKKVLLLLLTVITFSCKNEAKKEINDAVKKENYPIELAKVFEAHGGINTWRKAQVLSLNKGEEVHPIDLKSRKTVINTSKYSLGFN
ncbi:hypothetical protein [Polaribacter sp. IC073]|uniref:hypothetical protein n=1 Tax=Polaribacter sp. IC073 TaxID=2508540 RepID=UPI001CB995C4|nr:hypothetical protein [Polaribacter sp. IC073]